METIAQMLAIYRGRIGFWVNRLSGVAETGCPSITNRHFRQLVSRGLKHMLVADPTQETMAMHISQNDVLTMTSGPSIGHNQITIGVDTTYPVSTLTTTLITPLDTTNHHPTTNR